MLGKANGFASLWECHLRDHGIYDSLLKFHDIIHQEALSVKPVIFNYLMQVVVKAVNLIFSRALSHRQFCKLIDQIKAL